MTVVGPGGAGKTRLSLEGRGRRQAEEPVWLVELAPLGDPERGRRRGRHASSAPRTVRVATDGVASSTVVDRVIQHLGEVEALIVLDNCEHVIAEAARVSEQLLLGVSRSSGSSRPAGRRSGSVAR